MTIEEKKVLAALHIMELTPDHTITRLELKERFLSLSEKYMDHIEKYNKMKNAYDYLYDHMELLNEAIHNQLNPEHETHEYSYSWEDVKEVQGEVVEEKIVRRTIIRTDSLMNRSYEINSREDIDKYVEELKEKLIKEFEKNNNLTIR